MILVIFCFVVSVCLPFFCVELYDEQDLVASKQSCAEAKRGSLFAKMQSQNHRLFCAVVTLHVVVNTFVLYMKDPRFEAGSTHAHLAISWTLSGSKIKHINEKPKVPKKI